MKNKKEKIKGELMTERLSDKFNKLKALLKKQELTKKEELQKLDLIQFFKRLRSDITRMLNEKKF